LGRFHAADGQDPLKPQKSEGPPPYLSFITGPSRTADIERVLTLGVHGPERLVIVCVDDLGGGQ
jgi:L-lactate dehydrogenase complex protein LldG